MVGGERLAAEYVHRRAGEASAPEGVHHGFFIDDGGAGDIQEEGPFFHGIEFFSAEKFFRFRRGGEGRGDDVRFGEDGHDIFRGGDFVGKGFRREAPLHGDDLHAEGAGLRGEGFADASESGDEELLSADGVAFGTFPLVGVLVPHGFGEAVVPCEEERHGVLRHGAVMDAAGIGENDGAGHHGRCEKFFHAVRQGMDPTQPGRGEKHRLRVVEAPHGDGVGVREMGERLFDRGIRFDRCAGGRFFQRGDAGGG